MRRVLCLTHVSWQAMHVVFPVSNTSLRSSTKRVLLSRSCTVSYMPTRTDQRWAQTCLLTVDKSAAHISYPHDVVWFRYPNKSLFTSHFSMFIQIHTSKQNKLNFGQLQMSFFIKLTVLENNIIKYVSGCSAFSCSLLLRFLLRWPLAENKA